MKKDIYIIKNLVNDKVYIGQAKNAAERWIRHISAAKKDYDYVISKAMNKYGIDKFYYQILESQVENFNEREQYWIQQYNSRVPNGYNVAPGGGGVGSSFENLNSFFDSEEDIIAIIDKLKNTNLSMDKIAKQLGCAMSVISQINLGRTYQIEGIDYPIRKTRYEKEKIKQIHYSLQYELDKSMNQIAEEYGIDRSQLNEINQGRLHALPSKIYPLRQGRAFSINKESVDKIKELLTTDIEMKDIARQFNVSKSFVSAVNKGTYYFDSNISYPIRQTYQGNVRNRICFSPDELQEIIEELKTNKSIRKIAADHETCYSTIVNINNGSIVKYRTNDIQYPIRKLK